MSRKRTTPAPAEPTVTPTVTEYDRQVAANEERERELAKLTRQGKLPEPTPAHRGKA